ncbi:MAG: imidazolonepropionase, partial [Bacteroidales bacterium]|nr:imidazolonepropionase [Bacteroidales bacterium]
MKTLIRNISSLVGILPEGKARLQGEEMGRVEEIRDAYLLIEDGKIASFGKETDLHEGINEDDDLTLIDAEGGMVMPSFCDSHTHIVYAGSREGEFLDKI